MRKNLLLALSGLVSFCAFAQDSLKTVVLDEVVTTGTKFELPAEKSGKTIYKLTAKDLERSAGKTVADVLNEVPGVQTDGNFGTPGSNISYYLRGGRNKHTLVLIDGVPLNDPSAINAEYDLRYIPLGQIEAIEVLKGGLSTLYGTGAAAGVINIKLKEPLDKTIGGSIDVNAGSFDTFSQNLQVGGASGNLSYSFLGNNLTSKGFSAAKDEDPSVEFDEDGFSRQNGLIKLEYRFTDQFKLDLHTAYERFEAEYDDFEFTDANNVQTYHQYRVGLMPSFSYKKGRLEGKFFYNTNEREFESSFPSSYDGKNFQGEILNRHFFSEVVQGLFGLNYQYMNFEQKNAIGSDSTEFTIVDPYASLLVDLPSGLNIHAGMRLNTHNVYGTKWVYNVNPSFLFNQHGKWRYKLLASISSSYVTPSLYQLYSIYGNKDLNPEEAVNVEAGLSVYFTKKISFNAVLFQREESNPIDFVSIFDEDGNYVGSRYENLTSERTVKGAEMNLQYEVNKYVEGTVQYSYVESDKPESFYRIPHHKFGASVILHPFSNGLISFSYNFTGDRTIFDFGSFSKITLDRYNLLDVLVSYGLLQSKLTLYGAVNNVWDEEFIAIYGFTTRGRNFNAGVRFSF